MSYLSLVKPHPTFVVLGDSAAYGTGDEISSGVFRGWAGFLSENFQEGCDYFNFSRPGAKSSEVLDTQLKRAVELHPDICAVIVGGNDLLRNNFDPVLLHKNLQQICRSLLSIGSEVVMVELHDPIKLLRLPKLLARVLTKRVNAVNTVYRQIALEFEIITVQTRAIANVHDLSNWYIDRMHPSPAGHFMLARNMAEHLRKRGWAISIPYKLSMEGKSQTQNLRWLIRNGVPWFLKRSVDLLPAAVLLMAIEIFQLTIKIFKPEQKDHESSLLHQLEVNPEQLQLLLAS